MSRAKLILLATISSAALALAPATEAFAASSNVNSLTASPAIVSGQLFYCPIGATSDFKCTASQIAAFNYSLMSGDCTASSAGVITCTKTGGTAFGGLATLAPGAAGSIAISNGTAWTVFAGNTSGTQFLSEGPSGTPSWATPSGGGSGVSSLSTTCPVSSDQTGAVSLNNGVSTVGVSGTFSITASDCGDLLEFTGAAGTGTLPPIGTASGDVASPYAVSVLNANPVGGASVTIAGNGANINALGLSAASIVLGPGQTASFPVNAAGNGWDADPHSGPHTILTTFSAAGTATFTPNASDVSIMVGCIGPGGGGGSGAYAAASAAVSGGGGGGGASSVLGIFSLAQIGASLTVTTPAGGVGATAPANTGASLAGNNGTRGSNATFGSLLIAFPGGAGSGGQVGTSSGGGGGASFSSAGGNATATAGGSAGVPNGVAGSFGSNGATSAIPGIAGSGGGGADTAAQPGSGGSANVGGPGAGAGGGISTAGAAGPGGPGGDLLGNGNVLGQPAAGANGTSVNALTGAGILGGQGAGGGAGSATTGTPGQTGGNGGTGAGGGGGGSKLATDTTAAAGNGGNGGGSMCITQENL
jgi:hypothetical protein